MSEPLKGLIVAILSPYKVVINLGKANNVKVGMKFVIYEEGDMIKDPDGNELEKLELTKGIVEVTHIQEKISIAESFKVEKRIYNPLNVFAEYMTREIVTTEKIPLTKETIEEPKPSAVKVGDLVRQIE